MMSTKRLLFFLVFFYLATRIINLTLLPVFADEAIYIRWAQWFSREPLQYIFYPLYDGKTPLFIWLLGGILPFKLDPLWTSRMLSVITGLGAGLVIAKLTQHISGKKADFIWSFFWWIMLPFTLFYTRLALIDMLLTFWLALSTWIFFVVLSNKNLPAYTKLLPGIFWGLALITKTTAIYFLPVFPAILIHARLVKSVVVTKATLFKIGLGFLMGSGLLGIMAVSQFFPFLFQRSADFTFTLDEIISNPGGILVTNIFRMSKWILLYCSPLVLACLGLLRSKNPAVQWLCWGLLVWLAPFVVTGRVLSSRYLLPSLIFIVPLITLWLGQASRMVRSIVSLLLIIYTSYWGYFILFKPNAMPLPIEDRVQFLTEWSSGHGIKEVADFLLESAAQGQTILVATEGYFGTLPDGLMIYLDGKPQLANLRVEGVGVPILGVPRLLTETTGYDKKYIVVNEHRFVADPLPSSLELVHSYPRPFAGPPLLLLEYTQTNE